MEKGERRKNSYKQLKKKKKYRKERLRRKNSTDKKIKSMLNLNLSLCQLSRSRFKKKMEKKLHRKINKKKTNKRNPFYPTLIRLSHPT